MGPGDRQAVLGPVRARLRSIYAASGATSHLAALDEIEAWTGRSGRGFVIDSFWSAWDAFADADTYQDTVTRAVRYGRDTDTTAAIAGGLAGAWFGIEGIPTEWQAGLREPSIIRPLVDTLIETDRAGQHWRTSTSSPIRVDAVELAGTELADMGGSVGITFLPGKQGGGQYGDHWRDPHTDLEQLRTDGVDTLALLVEDSELQTWRVPELPEAMTTSGIELIRFPIPDPKLPRDPVAYRAVIQRLIEQVRQGRHVAVACRGGLDRSGMTVACLLREAGLSAQEAIDRVHHARRHSLTVTDQLDFVRAWPPE